MTSTVTASSSTPIQSTSLADTSAIDSSATTADTASSTLASFDLSSAATAQPLQQMMQLMQGFLQVFMSMMQTMLGLISKGTSTPTSTTPTSTTPTTTTPATTTPSTTTPATTTPTTTTPTGSGSSTGSTTTSGSSTGTSSGSTATAALTKLTVGTDDKKLPTVKTKDGWNVTMEGANQGWNIIGPDGKATRIFGDPHVVEADGDTFDFKDQSTFIFGDNKATVETTPAGNGEMYTKAITVYSGTDRVTISGIDTNKPILDAAKTDGTADDAKRADGNVYRMRDVDLTTNVDKDWVISESNSTK